jgi:hypothetical protein
MSDLFEPSLQDLILCAERELRMRERVYPRQVAAGRMSQTTADREIRLMGRILKLLEVVQERWPTRTIEEIGNG